MGSSNSCQQKCVDFAVAKCPEMTSRSIVEHMRFIRLGMGSTMAAGCPGVT
jgi:hypothetical protein